MPCDIGEMLRRQFYFFGTYFVEDRILDCWQRAAEKANVIFDVGANAGIYSLAALASQPAATVHAFEPTPEIAGRLQEAVRLNRLEDRLHVHELAVSDRAGVAALHRCTGDRNTNAGMNYIGEAVRASEECVATVRLDEFCERFRIRQVDLLKLDVQGHEHAVLRGAEGLIRSGRLRTIFMELNWADALGEASPASASVALLSQAGYRFADPQAWSGPREPGPWMRGLGDIVACHDAGPGR